MGKNYKDRPFFVIPTGREKDFVWEGECCGSLRAVRPTEWVPEYWIIPCEINDIDHVPVEFKLKLASDPALQVMTFEQLEAMKKGRTDGII